MESLSTLLKLNRRGGKPRSSGITEIYARLMNVFNTLCAAQGFFGDTSVPMYLRPGEYRTLYAGASIRF
jgi:hypothetical protein